MSLTLDPKTTALVLIDLQKGILANQPAPHSAAEIISNAVKLIQKFNELNAPVIRVHVGFSPDNLDRPTGIIDAPMPTPPGGFPKNFSEFVDEIANLPAAVTILKHNWSAFYGTELDLQLRRRNITTIVLAGVSTNIGVESTARDAYHRNYSTILAEDACASTTADMHQFSIQKIMPRLTRIRSTQEILAAL